MQTNSTIHLDCYSLKSPITVTNVMLCYKVIDPEVQCFQILSLLIIKGNVTLFLTIPFYCFYYLIGKNIYNYVSPSNTRINKIMKEMYVELTTLKWVILSFSNQEIPNRPYLCRSVSCWKCIFSILYCVFSKLMYNQAIPTHSSFGIQHLTQICKTIVLLQVFKQQYCSRSVFNLLLLVFTVCVVFRLPLLSGSNYQLEAQSHHLYIFLKPYQPHTQRFLFSVIFSCAELTV